MEHQAGVALLLAVGGGRRVCVCVSGAHLGAERAGDLPGEWPVLVRRRNQKLM
jgi:hypothetical protein